MKNKQPNRKGNTTAPQEFTSDAWLLEGITVSIPGQLDLKDGRLRFATIEDVIFDVQFSEVTDVKFPWYYFGGGVKLQAAGKPYRLSFVVPNGIEYAEGRAMASIGNPLALLVAASKIRDIRDGRNLGRKWRELLTKAVKP